jgi:hypothetical protein
MKAIIGGSNFQLAKCVLFFFILVLSCTSTSVMRLEGNDFKENLPGRWEGRWTYGPGRSDIEWLKIIKIDGNKVHLTGFSGGGVPVLTQKKYMGVSKIQLYYLRGQLHRRAYARKN